MRCLCLVGALVEVPAELDVLERVNTENACRDADAHSPADKVADDARELLGAFHLGQLSAVEERAVFAAATSGGQNEAAAGRFEVEVFVRLCGVLYENLDAGIFPAVSAVFLDFGAKTVERFLYGKVKLEKILG